MTLVTEKCGQDGSVDFSQVNKSKSVFKYVNSCWPMTTPRRIFFCTGMLLATWHVFTTIPQNLNKQYGKRRTGGCICQGQSLALNWWRVHDRFLRFQRCFVYPHSWQRLTINSTYLASFWIKHNLPLFCVTMADLIPASRDVKKWEFILLMVRTYHQVIITYSVLWKKNFEGTQIRQSQLTEEPPSFFLTAEWKNYLSPGIYVMWSTLVFLRIKESLWMLKNTIWSYTNTYIVKYFLGLQ